MRTHTQPLTTQPSAPQPPFHLYTVVIAILACNLHYPNFTHHKLSILGFLCGWLGVELAIEQAPTLPFCISRGDKNTLVPAATARSFAKKRAAESNNDVVYAQLSSAQQAFDMFLSIHSEHLKHDVERYLVWFYSVYRVKD